MSTGRAFVSAESFVPKGRDSFRVSEIAEWLECSVGHINRLIDAGEMAVVDPKAKKSMRRVARPELVRFLDAKILFTPRKNPPVKNPQIKESRLIK